MGVFGGGGSGLASACRGLEGRGPLHSVGALLFGCLGGRYGGDIAWKLVRAGRGNACVGLLLIAAVPCSSSA